MPTLQEAWENFHEGLKSSLRQWTALRLAVENNWGGGDSERKALLLEEELTIMFKTRKELFRDEVEDFLTDYLDDGFSTYAEDGSPREVATILVEMFAQCGRFDYTLSSAVRTEEERRSTRDAAGSAGKGSKSSAVARSVAAKGDDEEDAFGSDDDDDDDDDMGLEAVAEEREGTMEVGEVEGKRAGPDADGWETVPSKKPGKGRRR